MKTLRIKQVGEHWIFDRIDQLPIDNEMTKSANRATLTALPEQVAINEKVLLKKSHYQKKQRAAGICRRAQNLINKKDELLAQVKTVEDKNNINISVQQALSMLPIELKKEADHIAEITACDVELTRLNKIFDGKRVNIIKENPVSAHPRANEIGIFPEGFDPVSIHSEWMALANKQIKVEFKTVEKVVVSSIDPDVEDIKAPFLEYVSHYEIEDFRGCQYFFQIPAGTPVDAGRWFESEVITDLGASMQTVVVDDYQDIAFEKKDLTLDDMEQIRLQKLSAEDKTTEKDQVIDSVLTEAALMERKLVIQGSTAASALTASRAWYQEQLTEIEGKYA